MPLSLDFAFEGFRVLKERPRLVAFWGCITLIGNGVAAALLVAIAGPSFEQLSHINPATDVEAARAVLRQALPALLAFQLPSLIVTPILAAAVFRAVFGEDGEALGFLKFGPRELQLMAVFAANLGLVLGIPLACAAGAQVPGLDALALPGLLALGAAPWLMVRLSMNLPQSFAEKRVAIFDSFVLTRGSFWPLAGGFLVAAALAGVVLFLGEQVAGAIVATLFGGAALSPAPDMTSLQAFMSPERVTALAVVYGLFSPQVAAIMLGAQAAAYRRLSGLEPAVRRNTASS